MIVLEQYNSASSAITSTSSANRAHQGKEFSQQNDSHDLCIYFVPTIFLAVVVCVCFVFVFVLCVCVLARATQPMEMG